MSPTCVHCGGQTRPESRFCPRCGKELGGRLAANQELQGGAYRILRSVSKGGMGAVYLAYDRRTFDRLCVVKQMLDYYDTADPLEWRRAHERFEEEGRTLASLSHPGVPCIYAFFQEHGRFYIVMEYIQGENLETYVTHVDHAGRLHQGRRLPQEDVIRCTIQALRILEYLHAQPRPVVHQDVKPANLILESHLGEVRLVDFGTARAETPAGEQPGNGDKESIYGTDGYAAPEQYQGKPVPRSDVFSLAATAYHLLTDDDPREHPFKFPKLGTLPRELSVALERALRVSPEQRCTAAELRQALEALSTPRRTLESFTFPGGTQIRSVAALPALCDEHWDAARSFLYHGDFQRWLRDINRHDLVLAADDIIKQEENHDAGLERFLRVVDAGLPRPKVVGDPSAVDLGAVARESALIRRVTLLNVTRGYTQAKVSATQPWIDVHPKVLHLWAGIPADLGVHVHAEGLPFRSRQQGLVRIEPDGHEPVEIPVTATVSLWREIWRLTWRALAAALPEAWRTMRAGWRIAARVAAFVARPFRGRPLLAWLLWALACAGVAAAIHLRPAEAEALVASATGLQGAELLPAFVALVILGPPVVASVIWLLCVTTLLIGGLTLGSIRGAFRSFYR